MVEVVIGCPCNGFAQSVDREALLDDRAIFDRQTFILWE